MIVIKAITNTKKPICILESGSQLMGIRNLLLFSSTPLCFSWSGLPESCLIVRCSSFTNRKMRFTFPPSDSGRARNNLGWARTGGILCESNDTIAVSLLLNTPGDKGRARMNGERARAIEALPDPDWRSARRRQALPEMDIRRAQTYGALLKPDRERARSVLILRYAFRGAVNRLAGFNVRPYTRASTFLPIHFSTIILSLWIVQYIGLIMTFPP